MQPRISVVIPMFNTGAFLEKCVRSVMEQTFEALEIICVDDQSPDDSASIIEKLCSIDSRIKLIRHERNLGQGGARNSAVNIARGEYIANVDSDDWLKPDMLERMYAATQEEAVDIVCCGYDRITEAGGLIKEWTPIGGYHDNRKHQVDMFDLLNPALWNKLFRKTLCTEHGIRFPNYLNYEDLATTPRLVAEADSIQIIEDRLYNYVSRENSVVSTYSPKHMLDCFEALAILHQYLLEKKLMHRYAFEFERTVDKHLTFRINSILKSDLTEEQQRYHLKYYFFIKNSFLQSSLSLSAMSNHDLVEAISESALDLPSTAPGKTSAA